MSKGVLQFCSCSKHNVQFTLINSKIGQPKEIFTLKFKTIYVNTQKRWLSTNGSRRLLQKETPKETTKKESTVQGIPYSNLTIGVPKETWQNERRVALSPEVVKNLTKKGFKVNVETNAGALAKFRNEDYEHAGAKLVDTQAAFQSDIVLKIRQPQLNEVDHFQENGHLISFIYPAQSRELVDKLAAKKMNVFGKYTKFLIIVMIFFQTFYSNGLYTKNIKSSSFRCFKFHGEYIWLQSCDRSS